MVVSDYNWLPQNIEDSWVAQYCDNYLIYDRAHRLPESNRVQWQKNVGQNIYDIFDFIVTHYENLPKTTIFCRAAMIFPKDRKKPLSKGTCSLDKFLQLANNDTFTELHDFGPEVHNGSSSKMGPGGSFFEINNSWYFNEFPWKYFNSLNQFFRDVYIHPNLPDYIRFCPGGSYIVPKANILKYSKNFYERLREYVGWDVIIAEAHMLERALYTIFTCDYAVKPKYQ